MEKQKKIKKKAMKKRKLDLDIAQKVAINSLLATFSSQHMLNSSGLFSDPDEILNLIYAGANHLATRFRNNGPNNFGNPTEMKIRIKHDPNIDGTQIGFSFFKSIFTVYTPDDLSKKVNLDGVYFSLEDHLRNQLIDRLPTAEVRLALTIAEVCSQGERESYIQHFLPKDLKSTPKSKNNIEEEKHKK